MTDPGPVLAAAQARSAALVGKDVAAMSSLLHPNFAYVNASGQVLSREQYIDQYVRPDDVRWVSQIIHEPRVVEVGTTAVLTCLVHDVVRFGDEELDATFRSTFTWVRAEHGWQCLAGHTSEPRDAG